MRPYKGFNQYEPPHTHIDRDNLTAKFWLQSVSLAQNIGFPAKELRKLQSMVIEHQTQLLVRVLWRLRRMRELRMLASLRIRSLLI